MCSYSGRIEPYNKALKRKCLNPQLGMFLDEFNKLFEKENDKFVFDYHNMIQHLIECQPCRKQLSDTGKYILSAELFWTGHFLPVDEKLHREEIRSRLISDESSQSNISLIEYVLEKSIQEPWGTELKKIRCFIEE